MVPRGVPRRKGWEQGQTDIYQICQEACERQQETLCTQILYAAREVHPRAGSDAGVKSAAMTLIGVLPLGAPFEFDAVKEASAAAREPSAARSVQTFM
eukprot:CAMPEP_0115835302 /NCGR_PEP_ID=MMETSP0287-20121206/4124_1 /TAXON_ID=412157 /ORGANISM="Chrysochromulina rotalis, Strain UIO044" /LENGTH=97 /DNA_ID=CAMNT_0003288755 /DNA_START=408 /DNA_END=701 /DNA_ORIENTATION=+